MSETKLERRDASTDKRTVLAVVGGVYSTMTSLAKLLGKVRYRLQVAYSRHRPWAIVLARLDEWERRPDHNIGQGLKLIDAHIELWSDGSGKVLAELSTVCERLDDKGADISNLLTNLGAIGRMTKEYNFDSYDGALAILSQPITLTKAVNEPCNTNS